ncbi:MAG TPA: MBL fold metallo-hydrolase [Acidobacteriota bacterium]|nr:MBL fold metallo-hydrolase [Acidobacteriota bacterium]
MANTVFSQPGAALRAEKIDDNLYIVTGGMANTAFFIGDKEVVAIDAQMTADGARQMIEEIKKITSKPLTTVILTHSDADHINGLVGFPRGLQIISSSGARKEMEAALNAPNAPDLRPYLPTRTFDNRMEIDLGSFSLELFHFGPAHTSGDIVIYSPKNRLALVGDLVFIGRDPLIHRFKGGNSNGLIKTLQAMLKLDADRFAPGHNKIIGRAEIETLLKDIQEKQGAVKKLAAEGKTLEETKKQFGIATAPAKPGAFSFPSLVEVMYLEITGQ